MIYLIDECLDPSLNDCDANANCLNLLPPDKFSCTCQPGYNDVNDDGKDCQLIDECVDGTHNCDENAACIKTPGVSGFACECNSGWTDRLAADGSLAAGLPGLTCIDIDECLDPNSCDQTNFCNNTPGGFNCGCLEGFSGTNPNDCQDIDECADIQNPPCHIDGDCTNTVGSFTCACKQGYFGTGFNCADINECLVLPGKA